MNNAQRDYPAKERNVEYVSPSDEEIQRFVQTFCRRVAVRYDEDRPSTEFVRGFSSFMRVVIKIQTRRANQLGKEVNHVSKS